MNTYYLELDTGTIIWLWFHFFGIAMNNNSSNKSVQHQQSNEGATKMVKENKLFHLKFSGAQCHVCFVATAATSNTTTAWHT